MSIPPEKRSALLLALLTCCSVLSACDDGPAAVEREVTRRPGGADVYQGQFEETQSIAMSPDAGAVLKLLDTGFDHPHQLTADPAGRWLYVGTDDHGGHGRPFSLYIVDLRDFTIAGRIPIPEWAPCGAFCGPTPAAGSDGLFMLGRTHVATFSRPEDFLP